MFKLSASFSARQCGSRYYDSDHVMRQLTCKAEHKQKIKTVTLANFLSPTRFEDYTRLRPFNKTFEKIKHDKVKLDSILYPDNYPPFFSIHDP